MSNFPVSGLSTPRTPSGRVSSDATTLSNLSDRSTTPMSVASISTRTPSPLFSARESLKDDYFKTPSVSTPRFLSTFDNTPSVEPVLYRSAAPEPQICQVAGVTGTLTYHPTLFSHGDTPRPLSFKLVHDASQKAIEQIDYFYKDDDTVERTYTNHMFEWPLKKSVRCIVMNKNDGFDVEKGFFNASKSEFVQNPSKKLTAVQTNSGNNSERLEISKLEFKVGDDIVESVEFSHQLGGTDAIRKYTNLRLIPAVEVTDIVPSFMAHKFNKALYEAQGFVFSPVVNVVYNKNK